MFLTDLKAVNHILVHSSNYHKPGLAVQFLSKIVGYNGLLLTEGTL